MRRTLPIVLAAGALILSTACGGGEQSVAPALSATPLTGAYLTCQDAGPELITCDEDQGIAVTYWKEAHTSAGIKEVNQYFLTPLRVTSVEDLRAKRDWAWNHWDVWEKENIDICKVKLAVEPNYLMLQLKAPEDFFPPECLTH